MKNSILLSASLGIMASCHIENKNEIRQTNPEHPNILFLFADDQVFNTINALGNNEIITPNIDRLVQNGTTFEDAYIMGSYSGAVSRPSRAMLITGRNVNSLKNQGKEIPEEHKMIGRVLQENGYNCFGTGKWHNGKEAFNRCFNYGKEIFFGGMDDHWNTPLFNYDSTGEYENSRYLTERPCCSNDLDTLSGSHLYSGIHSTDIFSDAVINFLDDYNSDKPFFVYCSYMAPHDPRTMPQKYLDMYDTSDISLPPNFMPEHPFDNGQLVIRDEELAGKPREKAEIKLHIRDYYAMITHIDERIGTIIKKLEENGQLENTLIIFCGDNGLALGQHGLMGKQNLYEHSIHVPLVFSGPGVEKGVKRQDFVYLFDIYPTICEKLGFEVPSSVQGISFYNAFDNPDATTRPVMYYAYRSFQRAIRKDEYKFILYNVDGVQTAQLFNLRNDPREMKNLAGEEKYNHILEDLKNEMRIQAEKNNDTTINSFLDN
jgi:arylsulfatase A-like enzyme